MIVRVMGEAQYELDDGAMARLNELDSEAQAAVEAGDEEAFRARYRALLEHLRASAQRVPDDDLRPSDVILPPSDVSLEEARGDFSDQGLLPD